MAANHPPASRKTLGAELREQAWQYARLMRLDRLVGMWLLMWPAMWAIWISADGQPDPRIFMTFVLGVFIMRAAGCVMNDFADRKFDRHVARTRDRPLATGAIAPVEALVLFVALGLIAIALVLNLNRLTQMLAVVGGLLTIIYPYTKRFVSAPQLVMGAAFGWSIPMAFAAQTGEIPRLAWLMWLTVVIWALIYDTMYAMADREDDLLIGVKSTAILFAGADVFIVSALQVTFVLALLLVGTVAGLDGWYQAGVALAAGLMIYQRVLIGNREPQRCFRAFLNNQHVGAAVFAGILLDFTFRTA
jgi:4-hydroxybenzoate polyprenyltransferase